MTKNLISKSDSLTEGELTAKRSKIVNFKTLAKIARQLYIYKYIQIGKSLTEINDKILSDCYESIIAAIFLDSNIDKTEKFIINTLLNNIRNYQTEMNYKGKLIEACSKLKISEPSFLTEKKNNIFITKIKIKSINEDYIATGKNKKEAEKRASKEVLKKIKII